jgi:hypothetical protein
MKRIAFLAASLLILSTPAAAGPIWNSINLSISPADAPKVAAALDKLMKATGDGLTGSVSLMAYVAGGEGSVSHNIISSFDSRAEGEAWGRKVSESDAWKKYAKETDGMTQLGGLSRMNFVKSWGEDDAADAFWEIYGFNVSDAGAFTAALDALNASDAGKATGASVHLSEIAAAGAAPVTHLISVGYKSEAEAEKSSAELIATKAWATYLDASSKAATPAGAWMIRTVKTWGADAQ